MRELVASYLSKTISRRGFLKGLTKAGVSLAAAESVLKSLTPLVQASGARRTAPEGVKLFQGTGGGFRRAAYCVGRQVRVRQLRQLRCEFLRSLGRPAAAQIYINAARRAGSGDGRWLRQGVGRAVACDAGRICRAGQRDGPDVQRFQRADADRLLLLSLGYDAPIGARRFRRSRQPGAGGSTVD